MGNWLLLAHLLTVSWISTLAASGRWPHSLVHKFTPFVAYSKYANSCIHEALTCCCIPGHLFPPSFPRICCCISTCLLAMVMIPVLWTYTLIIMNIICNYNSKYTDPAVSYTWLPASGCQVDTQVGGHCFEHLEGKKGFKTATGDTIDFPGTNTWRSSTNAWW